jgi:hypothetical protein
MERLVDDGHLGLLVDELKGFMAAAKQLMLQKRYSDAQGLLERTMRMLERIRRFLPEWEHREALVKATSQLGSLGAHCCVKLGRG